MVGVAWCVCFMQEEDGIGVLVRSVLFLQAEDGIRAAQESRGLGDVYKRQGRSRSTGHTAQSPGAGRLPPWWPNRALQITE